MPFRCNLMHARVSTNAYMEIVVESLSGLALLCLIVWLALMQKSFAVERERVRREAQEAAERERLLQKDAERYHTHDVLRCLDCDCRFPGPLTPDGCPQCHKESLVVMDSEAPASTQRVVNPE